MFKVFFKVLVVFLMLSSVCLAGPVMGIDPHPRGLATPHIYDYSTSNVISDYYLDIPTLSANDTFVGATTTQTLTNKTLTTPTITGGTLTSSTITTPTITGGTITSSTITTPTITGATDVLEVVTGANTITVAESGKTFALNAATGFQSILPAISTTTQTASAHFRFVVQTAPSGGAYTIVTGNSLENKLYGVVDVNSTLIQAAARDTITLCDGSASIGDWIDVYSDGSYWYVRGQAYTAGAVTLTQAD